MDSSFDGQGIEVPTSLGTSHLQKGGVRGRALTIAVDRAKSVFEVAVSREPGRASQRKRMTRSQMASFFATRPPATVLTEACGTAHFWGRLLRSFGHRVLLLPTQHVCRDRLRDKTDAADALALVEAHRNEKIVPVPVKDLSQQAAPSVETMA
jgi:transposase